jgi:hypothetical protein
MQLRLKLPRFLSTAIEKRLTAATVQPGTVVEPPAALGVSGRMLLHFKSEGCAPCDGIDLFIGRLAWASDLALRVVDALETAARAGLAQGLREDVADWLGTHTEDGELVDTMAVYLALGWHLP